MSHHIPPPIRRRVEGYRWIRSDGKPNWNQHITDKLGEVLLIASKPPITIPKDSSILEATEKIASNNVRGLPIVESGERLYGVLTGGDLINYLGGGSLFDMVSKKFSFNIYESLEKMPVEALIYKSPISIVGSAKIDEALKTMAEHGVGFLPVIDKENTVNGVLTEHDLVKYLAGKTTWRTVAEVMSRTVIGIDKRGSLWEAMKLIVKYGFRRLLVFDEDKLAGFITAKGIVSFFGSHKAFKYVKTGDIREVLRVHVSEISTPYYTITHPSEDIGEVAERMVKTGLSGLPVIEEESIVGIITERDVLYGLLVR
ncbi:MAG: CBS domain-containing protein [Desulfurococcales archaeon]|nr:CBS domain-containing protein [Desulfurococcales archaeon]